MSFAFDKTDIIGLTADQKSAVMDALVAAAWADGSVSDAEAKRFEEQLRKTPLGSDEDTKKMIQASLAKVGALANQDQVMAFMKGVADKLPLPHIREKVLYSMLMVAMSEGNLNQNELNVLNGFAQVFGVQQDRIALIAKEAKG